MEAQQEVETSTRTESEGADQEEEMQASEEAIAFMSNVGEIISAYCLGCCPESLSSQNTRESWDHLVLTHPELPQTMAERWEPWAEK